MPARHASSPRRVIVVSLALLLAAACARERIEPIDATPVPETRRTIATGDVIGIDGRYGSHAWLGIPYAKPPVGALRWRAPQPAEPWEGVREAVAFGSPCPQIASTFGGFDEHQGEPAGREDCLFLNVWSPRFEPDAVPEGDARLPVMVWIHGGGNTIGHGGGFYDGGNLAATHGLLVVTLNYRLGPFGYLRHRALRADAADDLERSGNFATLDLIHALRWVRENAAAFGGDPERVTIFGESAGGTNVFTLLLSPEAEGLFHRAVAQSGGFEPATPAEAENFRDAREPGHPQSSNEILLALLERDGADGRQAARGQLAAMSDAEVARYLRGKTPEEILSVYRVWGETSMLDMPKVFGDGVLLPETGLVETLAAGRYSQVPVILGTNHDENKLFLAFDEEYVRRFLGVFMRVRDPERYDLLAEYLAKMWKATGADEPAAAMRAVQGPSVWVYRFDWDEEPTILGSDLGRILGAAHAFEIPFVFGHFDLGSEGNRIFTKGNAPGRRALSARMMSYWAALAHDGDPGRGRDGSFAEWRPWNPESPRAEKFLVLDTQQDGGVRMSSESVTRAKVLAQLESDPRLADADERCRIYRDLADRSPDFVRAYERIAGASCARYAAAARWND